MVIHQNIKYIRMGLEITHIPIVQSERCFRSFMSLGRVRMYMKWKMMATKIITPKCNKAWMEMFHISLSLRLKSGLLACLGQITNKHYELHNKMIL